MKLNLENTQTDETTVAGSHEPQWLSSVLLHRGERITRRWMYFYEKLQALPRTARRTLQKRLAMTLAGAALLLALSGAPSLHAATISVNPGSRGVGPDGGCSLVEAIITANIGTPYGDCSGGTGGDDIITLGGGTYSYNDLFPGTGNALPIITSNITINAYGATIQRDPVYAYGNLFRILQVTVSGNLTLNDATLSGGYTGANGGGIFNQLGTVVLNHSTISGNTALNGGGIYNLNGTVTLNNQSAVRDNGVFDNQTLATAGAGILNKAVGNTANLIINDSIVTGNLSYDGLQGSGIYNKGETFGTANLTITNSTIASNNSALDGGGIMNYGVTNGAAHAVINRSTVSNNTALNNGGGIYNLGFGGSATLALNNSTISSNTAYGNSGGIQSFGTTTTTIENSTIANNTGDGGTGGISGAASVKNSIIAEQANGDDCGTVVTSQGYNIESGASCGFAGTGDQNTILSTELLLDPLGEFFPDQLSHPPTHALGVGSVAIDHIPDGTNGCDGSDNTSTSVDQRGAARSQGAGKGGVGCDVGAFEYASPNSPTAVSLQSFTVTGGSESGLAPALLGLLTSAGLGGLWWRKRRADQPDEG